jgi:hypothetical protein
MARSSPSEKYRLRAEAFVKAVDIAAQVLAGTPEPDAMIAFGQQLKDLAQQPPQTLSGLRHLEAAFITYWNEASGPHVDRFWQLIADNDLPYARADVLGEVLRRGRIRNMAEYDVVVDSIVVAQQVGTITEEQAAKLNDMIGQYEQRRVGQ